MVRARAGSQSQEALLTGVTQPELAAPIHFWQVRGDYYRRFRCRLGRDVFSFRTRLREVQDPSIPELHFTEE